MNYGRRVSDHVRGTIPHHIGTTDHEIYPSHHEDPSGIVNLYEPSEVTIDPCYNHLFHLLGSILKRHLWLSPIILSPRRAVNDPFLGGRPPMPPCFVHPCSSLRLAAKLQLGVGGSGCDNCRHEKLALVCIDMS